MRRVVSGTVSGLLLVVGCRGSPRPDPQERPRPSAAAPAAPAGAAAPPRPTFRAATFNAGLATGVLPHVEQRARLQAQKLAEQDLDLLCLQEVWLEPEWNVIQSTLRPALPHALRPPPSTGGEAQGCAPAEFQSAMSCLATRCSRIRTDSLGACMVQQCSHLVSTLSPSCTACLAQNPRLSPEAIGAACSGGETRPRTTHAYGGSTGLALLTRREPLERDVLTLRSEQLARAVAYVRWHEPGVDDVHAFCTHLSTDLHVQHGKAGAWRGEQREQLEALIAFVQHKTGGRGNVIVLGDLNTGPAAGSHIAGRWPQHYARLIESGLHDPQLADGSAACTFCPDNPLVGGRSTGILIDHVLLRGFVGQSRAERILDEPVTLTGSRGTPLRSAYSDHYAVLVTVARGGA